MAVQAIPSISGQLPKHSPARDRPPANCPIRGPFRGHRGTRPLPGTLPDDGSLRIRRGHRVCAIRSGDIPMGGER